MQDKLYLGNLDAERDWGHAKDYVEAMYLMLQQDKPEDFVIATGVTTRVRDFVIQAFKQLGILIAFDGKGKDEKGVVSSVEDSSLSVKPGQEIINIDPTYYRPTEVDSLIGDASKARKKLGWNPNHDLDSLIKDMVNSDLKLAKKDKLAIEHKFKVFNYHE